MTFRLPFRAPVTVDAIRLSISIPPDATGVAEDFPGRKGDVLELTIDLDNGIGTIRDWPKGRTDAFNLTVGSGGSYYLLGPKDDTIASIERGSVPHRFIPGEWGADITFEVDANGRIKQGFRDADPSAFFNAPDEED